MGVVVEPMIFCNCIPPCDPLGSEGVEDNSEVIANCCGCASPAALAMREATATKEGLGAMTIHDELDSAPATTELGIIVVVPHLLDDMILEEPDTQRDDISENK